MARRRVHLSFPGKLKDEPLLWQTCEQFDLVFNIRRADYTEGMGWLMAELEGDAEQLEKGIRWLEEQGVIVGPIEQDVVQRVFCLTAQEAFGLIERQLNRSSLLIKSG